MVDDDHDNGREASSVNRRDVLGTLTTAGVALTVPRSVRADPGDTVEIVVERYGETGVRTKEVPAEWWAQMTRAREVHRTLDAQFDADPGVVDVRLGTSSNWLGDHRDGQVNVYVDPADVAPAVPSSVDGVPVERREFDPDGEPLDTCNTGTEDPVSAGWQIESDPDGSIFTGSSRVTDSNGVERLSTCSHGFDPCTTAGTGDTVTMSDDSYEIGEVDVLRTDLDYAAVGQTYGDDISGYDGYVDRPDEYPSELDITGWVTENGVADLVASDETVYKTGRTSCTTNGVVDEMYVSDGVCGSSDNHFVHATMRTDGGDSGAPYYVERYSPDFSQYYAAIVVAAHKGTNRRGSRRTACTTNWGTGSGSRHAHVRPIAVGRAAPAAGVLPG